MKKFLFVVSTAIFLSLFTIAAFTKGGQQKNDTQLSGFSDLTWEFSSTDKELVKLEPVPVSLRLCNKTPRPVLGHSAIALSENHVDFFVTRADGEMKKIDNLSPIRRVLIVKAESIAPGKCFEIKDALTLDLEKYFPEATTYQLQAVLHDTDEKEELRSKPVTIRIVDPEGADRQAYNFIKETKTSDFLFSGAGFPDAEKKQVYLEEFTSNFGESAYSDYATYLLGELYFLKKAHSKASEQFNKLAAKTDFVFAEKAKSYLKKVEEKTKLLHRQSEVEG